METIPGHLYDYPKYYDLIFGAEWREEYVFLQECFNLWARRPVQRIFEPGCGTGRLMIKLAQGGYDVSGLDLNPKAVDYCNARLQRSGYPASAFVGDMANFKLKKKVDACFNLINTFRHLPTEAAALQHFQCIADCLNKGGIYILGLHLTPQAVQQCTEESWTAVRGPLKVVSRLWSIGTDLKKREERIGVTYDVTTPTKQFRIEDETMFRTYTAAQMQSLFDATPSLKLVETYDFRYDLDWPIEIDAGTEDIVYVLQKQ